MLRPESSDCQVSSKEIVYSIFLWLQIIKCLMEVMFVVTLKVMTGVRSVDVLAAGGAVPPIFVLLTLVLGSVVVVFLLQY